MVLCIQPFFIFFVVCCWISLFYRTHDLSRDMHASWIRSKRNIQLNDLAATTSELYIYRGDVWLVCGMLNFCLDIFVKNWLNDLKAKQLVIRLKKKTFKGSRIAEKKCQSNGSFCMGPLLLSMPWTWLISLWKKPCFPTNTDIWKN